MLVSRHPVDDWVADRFEVTSTAQLFRTEALGHLARHLRDVADGPVCGMSLDAALGGAVLGRAGVP
jgi:hypothetical protein